MADALGQPKVPSAVSTTHKGSLVRSALQCSSVTYYMGQTGRCTAHTSDMLTFHAAQRAFLMDTLTGPPDVLPVQT
jgi:hypothetical protein